MRDGSPAARYAAGLRTVEIGGTKGKTHAEVLAQTLGRRDALDVETGIDARHETLVVGGERRDERVETGDGSAPRTAPQTVQVGEPG